jgi:hypothetical protein
VNLEGWVPAQEPLFLVDKGIPPAKLNLLKERVIRATPADGEVGYMTRAGGNGRDKAAPMIVQGRLRIRQSSSQIFEQEKLVKPGDPASGPWETLSSASVQQDNSIP